MKAWHYTKLHSKDNAAARRRRILHTLRKPAKQPTKLAEESEVELELEPAGKDILRHCI